MKDFKDRREEGFRRDPVIPDENRLEGRNAVLEAFRAGRPSTSFLCWTDARTDR